MATLVKVRKVGNSFAVTIPVEAVNALRLYDGQELEVNTSFQTLEYKITNPVPDRIEWSRYTTTDAKIRN